MYWDHTCRKRYCHTEFCQVPLVRDRNCIILSSGVTDTDQHLTTYALFIRYYLSFSKKCLKWTSKAKLDV